MKMSLVRSFVLAMCFATCGSSIYASTGSAPTKGTDEQGVASSVASTREAATSEPSASANVASSNTAEPSPEDRADGQASPTSGQQTSRRHSHHTRNILIGVGAILAFAVIFAIAAK